MDNRTHKKIASLIERGVLTPPQLMFLRFVIENDLMDRMWVFYKWRPTGYKYRFTIPFYFPASKVAVVVDDSSERTRKLYDVARRHGIYLHRVYTGQMASRPDSVLADLKIRLARNVLEPISVTERIVL